MVKGKCPQKFPYAVKYYNVYGGNDGSNHVMVIDTDSFAATMAATLSIRTTYCYFSSLLPQLTPFFK